MPTPILRVRDLTVRYHDRDDLEFIHALEGLSLDIFPGDDFALIGESGSGKSTFAKCILGQIPPKPGIVRGEITFANREGTWHLIRGAERVWRREESMFADEVISERGRGAYREWRNGVQESLADLRGKRISLITQDTGGSLNPYVPIGRQIRDCMDAARAPSGRNVYDYMGDAALGRDRRTLESLAAKYPSQLSGGQRQRVLIAMALASEPDLIIADEPTTGLDVLRRGEIIDLFENLLHRRTAHRGREMTFLLITHDLDIVRRLATRVAVLFDGRLMEIGPMEGNEIPTSHPYTEILAGSYDDLEFAYAPPETDEGRPSRIGCRYRRQCQVYAAHQRKAEKTAHDQAMCNRCETQEPPLFAADETGRHLVRCWARIERERWSEYEPPDAVERIGV